MTLYSMSGSVTQKWAKILHLMVCVALLPELTQTALCLRGHISHVVGGETTMWVVQADSNFYQTWAYSQQFIVGDKLVFHMSNNKTTSYRSEHNVVQFNDSKSFLKCNPSGEMKFNKESEKPQIETVIVDLPSPGMFYYGCSNHDYCTLGQKFFIKVWPVPAEN